MISETNTLDDTDGTGLLATTIAAHGGDAFLSYTSLTLTGTGTFTSPPQTGGLAVPLGNFTLTLAGGGRVRLVTQGVGVVMTLVVRGDGRGGYLLLGGRRLELPASHCDRIEPFALLRRAALRSDRVTIPARNTGDMTAEGKPLLSFQIHDGTGIISTVWVEADTRLVRKTVTVNARGEMTMLLGDYRFVDGVGVFGTMKLLENGCDVILLRVSGVLVNEPVSDALFA